MEGATEALRPAHRSFRLTRPPGARPLAGRAFLAAWVLYVMLSVLDCVTTGYALGHELGEGNPIAAGIYERGGVTALWAFKFGILALMLPLLTRLPRRLAALITALLAAVMWLNDISNLAWILRAG